MITLGTRAATSARKSRTQKRGIIFTVSFFLSFLLLSNKRFVPCSICFKNRQPTETTGPWPGICQLFDTLRKLSLAGLTPSLNLLVVDLWNDVFVSFWFFQGTVVLALSYVHLLLFLLSRFFWLDSLRKKERLLRSKQSYLWFVVVFYFTWLSHILSFHQEHRVQQDRSRRHAELSSEEFLTRIKKNHLRISPGSENVLLARHVCKDSKARVQSVSLVIFHARSKRKNL